MLQSWLYILRVVNIANNFESEVSGISGAYRIYRNTPRFLEYKNNTHKGVNYRISVFEESWR